MFYVTKFNFYSICVLTAEDRVDAWLGVAAFSSFLKTVFFF